MYMTNKEGGDVGVWQQGMVGDKVQGMDDALRDPPSTEGPIARGGGAWVLSTKSRAG